MQADINMLIELQSELDNIYQNFHSFVLDGNG